MLLLEQDTIRKERVYDKNVEELDVGDKEEYEIEVI